MKTNISWCKILLITGGIACIVIGTIGIFVPILPTTIFYILAAAAFSRSSNRLYHWIMHHPVIGRMIRNYRIYHAIPIRVKSISISFLWLTIGTSAVFAVQNWWIRGLLALIAVGVTWHLLALKTLTPQMIEEINRLDAEEKIRSLANNQEVSSV